MGETIAAIATASGRGGVAIIRLSGDKSLEIAINMFSNKVQDVRPNYMYSGNIILDGFKDYGFLVWFKAPKSFTGEDVVEFHCHGGVRIAQSVLKKCISLGARLADRGEFTKRAFLNGKLSLASAEGMADMINAESDALLRAGSMLYSEKLTDSVRILQNRLKDILAEVAVEIDYPEEDSDGADLRGIAERLSSLKDEAAKLVLSYDTGKKIKEGVTVAICGKPNTGKSSLLNALLGYDKAIVSDEEGTTRDAVEGAIELDGVIYNLIDTAGIRERAGAVESIGINRAKAIIACADVVLSVYEDEKLPLPDNVRGKEIKVFNKCDIKQIPEGCDIAVSAATGKGLSELKKLISNSCVGENAADKAFIIEERHFAALKKALYALESAENAININTLDIISVDLKDAWDALGEITGETASEEIISTVFAKFCVGK